MRRVAPLFVIWLAGACSDGNGPSSRGFQAVALSTGNGRQVCGITSDGGLYCWGSSSNIGLPDPGTSILSDTPVRVDLDQPVTQVVTGGSEGHDTYTCALTNAGAVFCWGNNDSGQLGDGTLNGSGVPVRVSLPSGQYRSLTAETDGTCAIAEGGTAYCWGSNDVGRFGIEDTAQVQATPVIVSGGFAWHDLALGDDRACGISEGQVLCWGGYHPQWLGIGVDTSTRLPLPVLGAPALDSITVSGWHQCGLGLDGVTYCWGANFNIGVTTTDTIIPSPIPLEAPPSFRSVHSLYKPTFALGNDGKGYWWGPAPYWTGGGPQTPEVFSGDLILSAIGTNDLGVCGIEQFTSFVYCWNQFSDGRHADPPVLVPEPSD
jgi:hypothetical protein